MNRRSFFQYTAVRRGCSRSRYANPHSRLRAKAPAKERPAEEVLLIEDFWNGNS